MCRSCKEEKTLTDFSPDNRTRKRTTLCKKCKADWMRNHRVSNPELYRESDLKKSYGINLSEYDSMLNKQNGVCAICNKPETLKRGWLHVDHNHKTRKVRGLLCGNCNTGIGKLGEDVDILKSAIEYLRRV